MLGTSEEILSRQSATCAHSASHRGNHSVSYLASASLQATPTLHRAQYLESGAAATQAGHLHGPHGRCSTRATAVSALDEPLSALLHLPRDSSIGSTRCGPRFETGLLPEVISEERTSSSWLRGWRRLTRLISCRGQRHPNESCNLLAQKDTPRRDVRNGPKDRPS